ncbi:MAG: hypothetical protein SLAVMIC_00112 [uncultured marine phage]|uniref:Uncharacterized protein n=1 Tax=uncultured marine phage TaxID=707152 RepID=A0A8D9CCH1_9VIRU|nr:MAG: hypothetical protein SLAVMIC_00112 [uncultured marine phage]
MIKKFNEFIQEKNTEWEDIHPDEMMAPFDHCECKEKEIIKRGESYFCEKW